MHNASGPTSPTMNEKPQEQRRARKAGVRNESCWKAVQRKKLRESGNAYVDRTGKLREGRTVRGSCDCKFKCSSRISRAFQELVHEQFWKLSDAEKCHFYSKFVERNLKARSRSRNEEKSRKTYSFVYFFQENGEKKSVCKKFFLNTLDISQKRIYYYFDNLCDPVTGISRPLMRGKLTKSHVGESQKEKARQHIKSFPTVKLICRKSCKSKEYLDANLNIACMYKLYASTEKNPIKENLYRTIFNTEFDLLFKKLPPKKKYG